MCQAQISIGSDACWSAVEARDVEADGLFVFAVTSTGIYCRPSCPARRPKRSNVRFFALNSDAEAAGFRACLRCHPKAASVEQRHMAVVEQVCRLIDAQLEIGATPMRLDELAERTCMSKFHLQRLCKARLGMSPAAYAKAQSDKRLRENLQAGEGVLQAVYGAGMNSSAPFYGRARQVLGMSPADYRHGGRFQKLWYAFAETRFGQMIVAGTLHGISAMRFGDSSSVLRAEIAQLFPKAELVEATKEMALDIVAVVAHVDAPNRALELPFDIQGSVFQHQVWRALTEIGFGETRTYSEIAKAIGKPKAVRAVANACGANPLAVAIPCHRVLRNDGSLGGYRWGTDRKQALLQNEASLRPAKVDA